MPVLQIWPPRESGKLREAGKKFTVYAWGDTDNCQLIEFLYDLKQAESPECDKVWVLIKFTSDTGPPRNPQKNRPLEGDHADKLFELKTSGGVRIIWFYSRDFGIVCTHGFKKVSKKELKTEIKKAQEIRTRFLVEEGERNG
jgi:Phage derived protein Gp49-like (DUF891)